MKKAIILGLLVIGIVLSSCRSMIPTTDNVYPTISFLFGPERQSGEALITISGEGEVTIGNVTQPFNFDTQVLYLKKDNRYATIISMSDNKNTAGEKGALRGATFKMPSATIIETPNIPADLPTNWREGSSEDINSRTFLFMGDRDDVRDGTAIAPSMIPRRQSVSGSGIDDFEFVVTATDYHSHTTTKRLYVRITSEPSHIGDR